MVGSLAAMRLRLFVPPREPYVAFNGGLDGLYSHLGIFPASKELSTCEGRLLKIAKWDGIGYPALIQNACSFGAKPPEVWVYDFDLWNFRHDDDLMAQIGKPAFLAECRRHNGWGIWYAHRRFGNDMPRIAIAAGGSISRRMHTT